MKCGPRFTRNGPKSTENGPKREKWSVSCKREYLGKRLRKIFFNVFKEDIPLLKILYQELPQCFSLKVKCFITTYSFLKKACGPSFFIPKADLSNMNFRNLLCYFIVILSVFYSKYSTLFYYLNL